MMMIPRSNFGLSLFDDLFQDPFFTDWRDTAPVMKTDIHEKDGNYIVEIDLPGYKKEDLHAELKDGYLTITAEKNDNKEEKNNKGNCIFRERYTGKCSRSFHVGPDVKEEDIKASFENGSLKLVIPNKDAAPAVEEKKYISIE